MFYVNKKLIYMAYCPKCGKKIPDDAVFCPSCGHNFKISRGMAEKQEKYEKNEKQEKTEKGRADSKFSPFIGGFVLVWVSICLYLAYFDYVDWSIFWAYIITGIGVVLLVMGVLMFRYRERGVNPGGMVIGGIVMIAIGSFTIINGEYIGTNYWNGFWQDSFWVFVPLVIGIIIIIGGLFALRRSPKTR